MVIQMQKQHKQKDETFFRPPYPLRLDRMGVRDVAMQTEVKWQRFLNVKPRHLKSILEAWGWLQGQIQPLFVNGVLWEHSYSHLFTYCLLYKGGVK